MLKENCKKLVVCSGKGGVGKSMFASALAMLLNQDGKKIVAVDCDVDAPNLAVWLNEIGKWDKIKKISVSEKPIFDYKKCISCGMCVNACQFNALELKDKPKLNQFLCEGCGACRIVCPVNAIKLKSVKSGEIKIKKTKYGFPLVIGQLYPGETGSGKIVLELKQEAEKLEHDIMIIDSSPGTGCPVNAALVDADLAILITESTPSGLSDLKRALEVVEHFKINYFVVINKHNINPDITKKIINKFKNKIIGKISYDKNIFKAIAQLKPILETDLKAKQEIKKIYDKIL